MSEKRFTLSKFAPPSQLSDVCDDGGKMLNSEVVDLLNEYFDKIISLETEVAFLQMENNGIKYVLKNIRKIELKR